jgi:opacity protein-like surface antigen
MKRLFVAAMLAILPTVASAQVGCYVGGSVGGSITQTEVPGITIAASGAIAGVEAGCDYKMDKIVLGGLARADWSDVKTSFAAGTMKQDATYTLAIRAGYMLNPDVMPYLIGGYAGLANIDGNGIMVGGGVEIKLLANLYGFAEYNHTEYRKWTDVASGDVLRPSSDVARVGVRLKF